MFEWWQDWKTTNGSLLPFGSSCISDEPNYVVEVLLLCERTMKEVEAYLAEKQNHE